MNFTHWILSRTPLTRKAKAGLVSKDSYSTPVVNYRSSYGFLQEPLWHVTFV